MISDDSERGATVINDRSDARKRIGRGGMADILSAAICCSTGKWPYKVLFPEFAAESDSVEQFRQGGAVGGRPLHRNIIASIRLGQRGGHLLHRRGGGGRAARWPRSSPRPAADQPAGPAEIASEVAAALRFAQNDDHVTHHDIKPGDNVIGSTVR